jgi:heme exporter protein C
MMKLFRSKIFLWSLAIAIAVVTFISFSTPIGGSFKDVVVLQDNDIADHSPVRGTLMRAAYDSAGAKYLYARDLYGGFATVKVETAAQISVGENFVADIGYDKSTRQYRWLHLVRVDPWMTFPLIQGLGELGRNMLFHVPMAMVAFIAFVVAMVNSILYLRRKKADYDRRARAASAAGLLFTILATVTGAIWAKFSWGSFWNWDPRQTSIFILLLIYFAYFILRSLLEESEDKKARVAAVYNIIAAVSMPFLMFVVPRITQSLHPGGGGDPAPLINLSGKVYADRTLVNMHWIAVVLYMLIYLWISQLYSRILKVQERNVESY